MDNIKFKIDATEFTRTLREYAKYSKKDVETIVNTKACFIARGATRITPKADRAKIEAQLGGFIPLIGPSRSKKGTPTKRKVFAPAPLAAIIINKRLGKGHGLSKAEVKKKIRAMIAARLKSIAFLKSGWIPAIKRLLPLSDRGGGPIDRTGKVVGRPKGYAKPANGSFWRAVCEIANTAGANKNNRGALITYGEPAFHQAVEDERVSMEAYILKKQRAAADKAGIKHN